GISIPLFNSSSPAISAFQNNLNHSEPLNQNSNELSFKGFSHVKPTSYSNVSDAVKKFGKIFGESAERFLKEKIDSAAAHPDLGLNLKNNVISFTQKSLGKRLLEIVLLFHFPLHWNQVQKSFTRWMELNRRLIPVYLKIPLFLRRTHDFKRFQ
ncbi:MAG: hypothetical protein WCL00_13825, partial [Bacteroidota bacterium]